MVGCQHFEILIKSGVVFGTDRVRWNFFGRIEGCPVHRSKLRVLVFGKR